MKMFRLILFLQLSIVLFSSPVLKAQEENDPQIDKIIIMYVDGKYEDCVWKSLKLTENSKYSRHPLPYIYASMSYFEICKNEKLQEKYPKAFWDAVKYADKFRKKDKKGEYYPKYAEYFKTLKDSLNKLGQHYFITEDYRKASKTYKYAMKLFSDDPVIVLWNGLSFAKTNNLGEAEKNFMIAMDSIKTGFKPDPITAPILAEGLLIYSEWLQGQGKSVDPKLKSLIEEFKKYDPEELDRLKKEEKKRREMERAKEEIKRFQSEPDDE